MSKVKLHTDYFSVPMYDLDGGLLGQFYVGQIKHLSVMIEAIQHMDLPKTESGEVIPLLFNLGESLTLRDEHGEPTSCACDSYIQEKSLVPTDVPSRIFTVNEDTFVDFKKKNKLRSIDATNIAMAIQSPDNNPVIHFSLLDQFGDAISQSEIVIPTDFLVKTDAIKLETRTENHSAAI